MKIAIVLLKLPSVLPSFLKVKLPIHSIEEVVDIRIHTDLEEVVPEDQVEAYGYQEAWEDTADTLALQVVEDNSAAGTAGVHNAVPLALGAANKPEAVLLELVERKSASSPDEIVEVRIHSAAVEVLVVVLDLEVDQKVAGNHLEQDLETVVAEAAVAFVKVVGLVEVVDEATDAEVDGEADAKDVVADEKDEDSGAEVDEETDEVVDEEIGEKVDEATDERDNRKEGVLEEDNFHPGKLEEVHCWVNKSGWKLKACWLVGRSGRRCLPHLLVSH